MNRRAGSPLSRERASVEGRLQAGREALVQTEDIIDSVVLAPGGSRAKLESARNTISTQRVRIRPTIRSTSSSAPASMFDRLSFAARRWSPQKM